MHKKKSDNQTYDQEGQWTLQRVPIGVLCESIQCRTLKNVITCLHYSLLYMPLSWTKSCLKYFVFPLSILLALWAKFYKRNELFTVIKKYEYWFFIYLNFLLWFLFAKTFFFRRQKILSKSNFFFQVESF